MIGKLEEITMIVDSMTHAEVYKELERDRENMSRWWWHQHEGRRRKVMKCKKFPIKIWEEYTSPRKVLYHFFTTIFEKRMRHVLTGVVALRRMPDGWAAYTTWTDDADRRGFTPMVILPHAFKRYAERCHVNKTGIDLIKHYLMNNARGKDSSNQKAVGRSVRYAGMTHLSRCANDGVLLGQVEDCLIIFHTFITYDMCSGQQKEEFDGCSQQIPTDTELLERRLRQKLLN